MSLSGRSRQLSTTISGVSVSEGPPRASPGVLADLLIGLFWSLAALKHHLLYSSGWDLGIYDQVAWQMSQGLEPRSTLLDLHHMGNHGAWMFYAIAPLYWLAPSVQWLFFTQALGLIITAWPLWHLGRQAGLRPRQQWLTCGLWWLQPVVFNVNLFDFHPETWAMPLLALAIWANRAERRWLWLIALFAAMGCRDGLTLIVMGLALEQALRRRWRWAVGALLAGGGWLLFLAAGLYPMLNKGVGVAAVSRYSHLCEGGCEGAGSIIPSALLDPIYFLGALNWGGIVRYLLMLALPLIITWRLRSLPMLAATLPLLAANTLSSWSSQQDVSHQYSLPLAVPLVVASIDGLAGDRLQRRFWLLSLGSALLGRADPIPFPSFLWSLSCPGGSHPGCAGSRCPDPCRCWSAHHQPPDPSRQPAPGDPGTVCSSGLYRLRANRKFPRADDFELNCDGRRNLDS